MGGSISCVSTSHWVTCQLVCQHQTINARMPTPSFLFGQTFALMRSRAAPVSLAEHAVSILRYPAPRPIASLTLNGAQCISPITLRRRILRCACTRIIPTSGLTSSLALCSPAATSCMSRVCRDRTTPLRRTSAMPARRAQGRVPTRVRVAELRRLRHQPQRQLLQQQRLRQQLRQQQQQQQQPQPQPQQQPQLARHRDLHLQPAQVRHQGLARLRILVPSTDDVTLRCPGGEHAVRTPGARF